MKGKEEKEGIVWKIDTYQQQQQQFKTQIHYLSKYKLGIELAPYQLNNQSSGLVNRSRKKSNNSALRRSFDVFVGDEIRPKMILKDIS